MSAGNIYPLSRDHGWPPIAAAVAAVDRIKESNKVVEFAAFWLDSEGAVSWSKTNLTPMGAALMAAYLTEMRDALVRQMMDNVT